MAERAEHAELDGLLAEIAEVARARASEGEAADFIPSMAEVPPDTFAMVVTELDGDEHVVGEVDVAFPIQSIAKVFSLALVMELGDGAEGEDETLWSRVGREPSGDPFNSLVQLEHECGVPRNPMINAGALVVVDLLLDRCDDPKRSFREFMEGLVGEPLELDESVLEPEGVRGHRNLAMAYLMSSFGNLRHDPTEVLDVYVHQCALRLTTRQLARAAGFLANGGVHPGTGSRVVEQGVARRVAALMLTSGTYDSAGEFAFSVGIPCKSGVAGGIVGVVAGELSVAVWSPPLDETGNSLAGRAALHELSERLRLSLFSGAR